MIGWEGAKQGNDSQARPCLSNDDDPGRLDFANAALIQQVDRYMNRPSFPHPPSNLPRLQSRGGGRRLTEQKSRRVSPGSFQAFFAIIIIMRV